MNIDAIIPFNFSPYGIFLSLTDFEITLFNCETHSIYVFIYFLAPSHRKLCLRISLILVLCLDIELLFGTSVHASTPNTRISSYV